jgi:hypothetical protein
MTIHATKLRLAMAIQAVSNGDSIRQAAAEERVDRSLLRRRLLGVPSVIRIGYI